MNANDIEVFRADFIRDVIDIADQASEHPVKSFVERVIQRFSNEIGMPSDVEHCYLDRPKEGRFKRMKLDAGAYDETLLEADLFLAEFNEGPKETLGREDILDKVKCLVNFYSNACNGYYPPEASGPEADLANRIRKNRNSLNRLHLFIFTTNQLSNRIKEFNLPPYEVDGVKLKIKLDIVDIERLYNNLQGPEEFTIDVDQFGCKPIPCVKADIETDAYETYLAIVPAKFLAEIYKEFGGRLLKANVRSFLNMTGGVNKGIRFTIQNEPERFFAYNNGIATTAKSVQFETTSAGLVMKSFDGLQIINGGQTTASLALVSVKEKLPLDNIFVQMKLTIVKGDDKEFIRNIAKYANSQTKVTTTDLNSSHEYYVALETLSRRMFAPVAAGAVKPTKWFFERTKKQYEQPMFQMTKAEKKRYQNLYPKKQKITVQELARNVQLYELKPYDVAWGGELNARRFHEWIEELWDQDRTFCNEVYFRKIVSMSLLYSAVKRTVMDAKWYQNKKGNLAQIVAYAYSKLVHAVKDVDKEIDLMQIWDAQEVPSCMIGDIASIAKMVFDDFYDPAASHTDVREYCKSKECWDNISGMEYELSDEIYGCFKDVD